MAKSFKISNFRLRRSLPEPDSRERNFESSTARNVISSHLTWGVTWIREFGFRFCPEEAKKHWRFEKGSLRTELWLIGSTNTLGSGIKSQVGLIWAIIMTGKLWSAWVCSPWRLDSWSYGTDITYRGELSSSHLEVNNDKITDTDGTREVAPGIWCELIFHDYANLCIRF